MARALRARGYGVTVCEKESEWAMHQTGRNSGVVHSGLYYHPGGLKARLCVAGAASMATYARGRGLPVDVGGKLVVAVDESELPTLAQLQRRGMANGVPVRRLDAAGAREYEPQVRCVAELLAHAKQLAADVTLAEAEQAGAEEALESAHRAVSNLVIDGVPASGEDDYVVLKQVGQPPELGFDPRDRAVALRRLVVVLPP